MPGDHRDLRIGKARHAPIGQRQPRHQVDPAVRAPLRDIIGRPVEPLRQIGQLHGRARRPIGSRDHRQRRARRQVGGGLRVKHPFGQAAAPQCLITLRRAHDHAARRPCGDDRILLRHLARGAIGAAQRHAALEIGVDQSCGRQQPVVAIFLPHPLRQAGQHGRFRHQPFGHALEPDHAFALRQVDGAGFRDERIAARPLRVDRAAHAARLAINGQRHRIGPWRHQRLRPRHRWHHRR